MLGRKGVPRPLPAFFHGAGNSPVGSERKQESKTAMGPGHGLGGFSGSKGGNCVLKSIVLLEKKREREKQHRFLWRLQVLDPLLQAVVSVGSQT